MQIYTACKFAHPLFSCKFVNVVEYIFICKFDLLCAESCTILYMEPTEKRLVITSIKVDKITNTRDPNFPWLWNGTLIVGPSDELHEFGKNEWHFTNFYNTEQEAIEALNLGIVNWVTTGDSELHQIAPGSNFVKYDDKSIPGNWKIAKCETCGTPQMEG